jgi:AmmeMemoRadiSam system protein B
MPRLIPKALIVLHAGHIYSGGVAAASFATLRGSAETIKRVVLIGPAHYVHVPGIAVSTFNSFETPLGHVLVDLQGLSTLAGLEFVVTADGPYVPEHCLEVGTAVLAFCVGILSNRAARRRRSFVE